MGGGARGDGGISSWERPVFPTLHAPHDRLRELTWPDGAQGLPVPLLRYRPSAWCPQGGMLSLGTFCVSGPRCSAQPPLGRAPGALVPFAHGTLCGHRGTQRRPPLPLAPVPSNQGTLQSLLLESGARRKAAPPGSRHRVLRDTGSDFSKDAVKGVHRQREIRVNESGREMTTAASSGVRLWGGSGVLREVLPPLGHAASPSLSSPGRRDSCSCHRGVRPLSLYPWEQQV